MAKIKSQFLVSDTSFDFNINFAGLPYEMTIDIPQGILRVAVDVPSSEDFEDDASMGSFAKHYLEEAEKGVFPYLGINCLIVVELEKDVSQQIVESFKKFQSLLENISRQDKKSFKHNEINFQQTGNKKDKFWDIECADKIFMISRKYLKKFLLSLRERGNFCRLKFFDHGNYQIDKTFGFFNQYYYIWSIKDKNDVELYRSESFLLGKSRKESLLNMKISGPVDAETGINRRDGIINETVWEQILCDMKNPHYEADVAKTFLLDAQKEALSINNNLAILSAAVACEVFTKRFISVQAKKTGNEFYDYVIKQVREISVIELLDTALKSLVGRSIKEDNRPLWDDLDRLFQARNKVAHVGKCYYMSRSRKTKYAVDNKKLMDFIERVYELFEILESYANSAKAGQAH